MFKVPSPEGEGCVKEISTPSDSAAILHGSDKGKELDPYAGGMADMKEISFTVTVDEANLILRGIGLLPFAEVYQLVAKLQQQAGRQLERETDKGEERRPAPAAVSGV